jgi:hypothetical protein
MAALLASRAGHAQTQQRSPEECPRQIELDSSGRSRMQTLAAHSLLSPPPSKTLFKPRTGAGPAGTTSRSQHQDGVACAEAPGARCNALCRTSSSTHVSILACPTAPRPPHFTSTKAELRLTQHSSRTAAGPTMPCSHTYMARHGCRVPAHPWLAVLRQPPWHGKMAWAHACGSEAITRQPARGEPLPM